MLSLKATKFIFIINTLHFRNEQKIKKKNLQLYNFYGPSNRKLAKAIATKTAIN